MEVKLFRMKHGRIPQNMLEDCVLLYCQIWQEPPWNEYFWTKKGVLEDLEVELCEPGAIGLIAVKNSRVIGFSWGYQVACSKLQEISGSKKLDYLFNGETKVFYIDELGVERFSRRHGVAEHLSKQLISGARQQGAGIIVLRTDKKAIAAKSLYRKLGFEELDIEDENYPDRTYWVLRL